MAVNFVLDPVEIRHCCPILRALCQLPILLLPSLDEDSSSGGFDGYSPFRGPQKEQDDTCHEESHVGIKKQPEYADCKDEISSHGQKLEGNNFS